MNIADPKQVKSAVAHDLKMRHLTQRAAGEMLGLGRNTMANILSNGEYFNEKQAVLFGLAFGYSREFLTTGKGNLLAENSPAVIRQAFEYRERLLNIFRQVNNLSSMVLNLVTIHGVDNCKGIINKMNQVTDFVRTLDNFPTVYVNGKENPPYDIELMEAAERIFTPLYDEIIDICQKTYGVEIDR